MRDISYTGWMLEILIVHWWANSIRASAAAVLVGKDINRFHYIIFSWWNMTWESSLLDVSEALSMRTIFLKHIFDAYPAIDTRELETRIILERDSYDTEDNAQKVVAIIGIEKIFHFTLLSSLSHLPRIRSIYFRLGFRNITTISAERLFYENRIKSYFWYIISYDILRAAFLEIPLYILTQFVFGRKLIRSKTIKRTTL